MRDDPADKWEEMWVAENDRIVFQILFSRSSVKRERINQNK